MSHVLSDKQKQCIITLTESINGLMDGKLDSVFVWQFLSELGRKGMSLDELECMDSKAVVLLETMKKGTIDTIRSYKGQNEGI